jgi:hypothetical protein
MKCPYCNGKRGEWITIPDRRGEPCREWFHCGECGGSGEVYAISTETESQEE